MLIAGKKMKGCSIYCKITKMNTKEKIKLFLAGYELIAEPESKFILQENTISRADKIVNGIIFFNNTQEVDVGKKNIDWLGGHIDHQEWRAQLNRFYDLTVLISAWKETQDEKYPLRAKELIEDWLDFMKGGEAESTHSKDNKLNLSIRIGNGMFGGWTSVLYHFNQAECFDDLFFEKVTNSIDHQVQYLMNSTFYDTGNWRIAILDSMIHTAIRLPFIKKRDNVLKYASLRMRNALTRQFNKDGSHIELTPNYHFWMSRVLAYYYQLNRKVPELNLNISPEIVAKALNLNGYYERFPINDSLPLYDKRKCSDIQKEQSNLLLKELKLDDVISQKSDLLCSESGFLFASDKDTELFFDASHWGGSHSHCSRLQVAINSSNKPLLIDPGVMSYEMSDPFAAYGKGTSSHSTININGLNQGPANAQITLYDANETINFCEAVYNGGYWTGKNLWGFSEGVGEGLWAQHTRALFFLKNEYVLILDAVPTEEGRTINNCWQFAPFDDYEINENEYSFISKDKSGANILLKMLKPPAGTVVMKNYCGTPPPAMRGWAGIPGQKTIPAPLVEFSYPGGIPAGGLSAVILAPFTNKAPEYKIIKSKYESSGHILQFEFETPEGYTDYIVWSPGTEIAVDESCPIVTDASFAFVRKDSQGNPLNSYYPNGSYLH